MLDFSDNDVRLAQREFDRRSMEEVLYEKDRLIFLQERDMQSLKREINSLKKQLNYSKQKKKY